MFQEAKNAFSVAENRLVECYATVTEKVSFSIEKCSG